VQDGKPYIGSVVVGAAQEDQRAQGFTVAAILTFNSPEDMQYYDTECEAHKNLKASVKTFNNQGVCIVYFEEKLQKDQGNY
jgi:hypothetical protein